MATVSHLLNIYLTLAVNGTRSLSSLKHPILVINEIRIILYILVYIPGNNPARPTNSGAGPKQSPLAQHLMVSSRIITRDYHLPGHLNYSPHIWWNIT